MYGSVTYEELFSFFQREIKARLTVCRNKSADDPLYINALNSAESLVQSFLVVGELVINKYIFDNKLDGERFDDARKRFLEDYNELTSLLLLSKK